MSDLETERIRNETIEECALRLLELVHLFSSENAARTAVTLVRALKDTRSYNIIDDATGEAVGTVIGRKETQ